MNDPLSNVPHIEVPRTRREFLLKAGGGFGALALNGLLRDDLVRAAPALSTTSPLLPKPGHASATAQAVIFLFMEGGPSHIDLFDPKPRLQELAGQPLPESFGKI